VRQRDAEAAAEEKPGSPKRTTLEATSALAASKVWAAPKPLHGCIALGTLPSEALAAFDADAYMGMLEILQREQWLARQGIAKAKGGYAVIQAGSHEHGEATSHLMGRLPQFGALVEATCATVSERLHAPPHSATLRFAKLDSGGSMMMLGGGFTGKHSTHQDVDVLFIVRTCV